ncbi:hypothetical protein [Pseudoduganella armeniaca]|uniref:Uncharacterized protein n=1 Tax=Pseudoduganella armeniaca TaxID=2072590 RepID=A0A2R4CHP3_9BURK|nr:hypothetical protein [Pseudoduganella armeniaca]AVR99181.1 hypothetical protein C9I28_13220 [Pseudoduganella armeniaca]
MKLFGRAAMPPDAHLLGQAVMALRCDDMPVPPGTTVSVLGADGRARRAVPRPGSPVTCGAGEAAWCWHAGPYAMDLVPFAAAPEVGLRLQGMLAGADALPGGERFELLLAAEAPPQRLTVAAFAALVQGALRGALAQGLLELPPGTALEEWHAFRAGVNELLYTRFSLIVTDCVPVDLGDIVDYAAMLRARAERVVPAAMPAEVPPEVPADPAPVALTVAPVAALDDAQALRRLFLELPALAAQLRALPLPEGAFAAHRELLQQLALAALDVNTMPHLALAAPDRPLAARAQASRVAASAAAVAALDHAWGVLARMKQMGFTALQDEAARALANLAQHLARRRAVDHAAGPVAHRREPTL